MTDTTDNRALVKRIEFEAVNSEIDRHFAGEIINALTAAQDRIEALERDALKAALETRPAPVPNEKVCDRCGGDNFVWCAPNHIWNLAMGGSECTEDPGGFLCPNCFIRHAESTGISPTAWVVSPEVLEAP